MKIAELRIGNLVTHDDYTSESFIVEDIRKEALHGYVIHTKGGKNSHWTNAISLIKGIPLTEERLEEFGFFPGFDRNKGYWVDDNFHYKKGTLYKPGIKSGTRLMIPSKKLEYVHQLQNLYFTARGKELKKWKPLKEKRAKELAKEERELKVKLEIVLVYK